LATVPGLRVQFVTLAAGQSVPLHRHSEVSDTILPVVGPVVVEMQAPGVLHRLAPGERLTIPAGTPHLVHGEDGAPCRFLNLHAGGAYDFQAIGAG
jgi:quercetin dioxygenase-like cupin family protein